MYVERSGDRAVADVNSRGRLVKLLFVNLENNKELNKHSTGFRLLKP